MLIQDGVNIVKNGINLDCLKMTLLLIMLKVIDLFILLNGLMSISCTSQSMFGTVIESSLNYSFAPSSVLPVDRFITFSESPLQQLALPHDDALVLTLEVGKHLMKRILLTPSVR